MRKTHPLAWQAPEAEFAMTFCRLCAAGWTRGRNGQEDIIVCLLNQETALINMNSCNRFEEREDQPEMPPRMPQRPKG